MKLAASFAFLAMVLAVIVGGVFGWIGYHPPTWVGFLMYTVVVFGVGASVGYMAGDES